MNSSLDAAVTPTLELLNISEMTSAFSSALNNSFVGSLLSCTQWREPQHILFQLSNTCFCVSFLAPNGIYGTLFMHGVLIVGFLLFSTWAWNVICAPDVFSWNFSFMILNMGQMLYIIYQMRPVRFARELEEVYQALFQPMQVSRQLFKKLVSLEYAQMLSLHAGEAYAMQNLTRTDRLGLLISGKVNVMSDHHFLHHIDEKQFLDSPEFESSRSGIEEKFKVSIVAATPCRYMFWQREGLEYLFVKETYLAYIMSILIARDITTKLYAMNEKIVTEKGSHLDIRLPSITSSLTSYAATLHNDRSPVPSSRTLHSSSLAHASLNSDPTSSSHRHIEGPDSETSSGGTVLHDLSRLVSWFNPRKVFDSKERLTPEQSRGSSEPGTAAIIAAAAAPLAVAVVTGDFLRRHEYSKALTRSTSSNEGEYPAIGETWPVTTS